MDDKHLHQAREDALHKTLSRSNKQRVSVSYATGLNKLAESVAFQENNQTPPTTPIVKIRSVRSLPSFLNESRNNNESRIKSTESTPGFGPMPSPHITIQLAQLKLEADDASGRFAEKSQEQNEIQDQMNTLEKEMDSMCIEKTDANSKNTVLPSYDNLHAKSTTHTTFTFGQSLKN